MEQKLVLYTHNEFKLYYIGGYNVGPKFEISSSLRANYGRAKSEYAKIKNDEGNASIGGFMMALINTDYKGWERSEIAEVYPDSESASKAKMDLLNQMPDNDWMFVGRERAYVKGEYGKSKVAHGWNKKFNVAAMKIAKIQDKVEFIVRSMGDIFVPHNIHNDAYMAVIGNPTHSPRGKNFGSYEVDSMSTLFRYVRNYLGFDLDHNVIHA